jgi:NDP-sugar pyrophosphorylase family protein
MAAGRSARLGGPQASKALMLVAGKPLLEYTIDQLRAAEIKHLAVAGREEDLELRNFLRLHESSFDSVTYIPTTPLLGTGGAVRALLNHFGGLPHVITTVDTIAPTNMIRQLVTHAEKVEPNTIGIVIAARYVNDRNPIWIDLRYDTHRTCNVLAFSKDLAPTGYVFGNVRWFSKVASSFVSSLPQTAEAARDSLIMQALIKNFPNSIRALRVDPVYDIDDQADLRAAERWLTTQNSQSRSN